MNEKKLRKKIIALCLQMNVTGLNQGTSGNISARYKNDMLITPSGIPYAELQPADIARMKIDSEKFEWDGPCRPSSEWHFHRAVLKARPNINAVAHTHSCFATVVSIARETVPACHYMIAAFGGNTVRCAEYETFGSPELSASILKAMEHRTACLLANHGMVVGGRDLDNAMWAAVELETLCKQYFHAKLAGNMVVLPNDEMAVVLEKFTSYGQLKKAAKNKGADTLDVAAALDRVPVRRRKRIVKKVTSKKTSVRKVAAKKP